MKKRSGNISILVIFVLLASSLLGVLSMNFVQQMMKQSAAVTSYYKAYYLSKAWIELWLTAIQHRGIWFQYTVNTGDALVRDNFFSGYTYSLFTTISGTASLLSQKFWQSSGCDFPYVLSGGESLIIPLFRDTTPWTLGELFTKQISYTNLAQLLDEIEFLPPWVNGDVTYGILILSGNALSQNGTFFQSWTLNWGISTFKQQFEEYLKTIEDRQLYGDEVDLQQRYNWSWLIDHGFRMYLLISNSSRSEESFCIVLPSSEALPWQINILPTDTFFIQSQASFGDQRVGLDASYAQPIPGFLFNAYSNY